MGGNQIICTCNGVPAAQIEKAVQQGAKTFDDVQQKLHIGKQCIKCKEIASMLIESLVEEYE